MPYPDLQEQIADLVQDHTHLDDEPLLIAIYYASRLAPHEECLFEVARHFGMDEVGDDDHIFQVQFGSTPNFPLPDGDRLRLFLTNAVEFRHAIKHGWPETQDLMQAIASDQAEVLFQREGDAETAEILAVLYPAAVPVAA